MSDEPDHAPRTLTIGRPPDDVFGAWRDPSVLPRVMGHVADVRPTGDRRATWSVHREDGDDLSWDTEVVEVDPRARRLRWQSLDDDVTSSGELSVREAPNGLGSEVTLDLTIEPAAGPLDGVAGVATRPIRGALAATALRRFKSLVETGEIPTLDRNPSARRTGAERR